MESPETRTFKPRFYPSWVWALTICIAGELNALLWASFFPHIGFYIWLTLAFVFLGATLYVFVRPLWIAHITIGDDALSGWVEKIKGFHIPWDEVEAACCYRKQQPTQDATFPFLWVATSDRAIEIPLSIFDQAAICRLVQGRLRAEQWGKASGRVWMERKGLYSPAEHLAKQQRAAQWVEETASELLRAEDTPSTTMGRVGFLMFAFLTFAVMQACGFSWGEFWIALFFWGTGLVFVLMTLKSVVEMTHNTITWLTFWGCFQIHWDEIKHVAYVPSFGRTHIQHERAAIHYRGGNKSFYAPGPDIWKGENRFKMRALLENQLYSRNIRPSYTWNSALPSSNTRLSWRAYFDQIPALSEERRALVRSVLIPAWTSLGIAGLSTLGLVAWGLVKIFNG